MNIIQKSEILRRTISKIGDHAKDFIPFNPTIDSSVLKRHLELGKWSLLHLSAPQEAFGTMSLRIIPWKPSNQWSVGRTSSFYESYFGYTALQTYLNGSILDIIVNSSPYFTYFRNYWNIFYETREPICDLFEIEDGLKLLKDWIHDESNMPLETTSEAESLKRLKHVSLLVNSSEENQLYWRLVDAYQMEEFVPEVPNIELSLHEERIFSSIADRASMRVFNDSIESLESRLLLSVQYAHGFGSESAPFKGQPSVTSTAIRTKYPLEVLFDHNIHQGVSDHLKKLPEFYIASKMYESGDTYNGIAHIEVAALMNDQLNDPQKAWKYLQAAGYWVGKNMPEAQQTVLNAAMHLCDKHNWKEALEVLEYNKRIMET